MCFSRIFHWWSCGARQIERGGYEIQWKSIKHWILSKILLFEGSLWASRRAPMPWRALKLTEMKSLMNLEDFCTFNRLHISKTHLFMKIYLGNWVRNVKLYTSPKSYIVQSGGLNAILVAFLLTAHQHIELETHMIARSGGPNSICFFCMNFWDMRSVEGAKIF